AARSVSEREASVYREVLRAPLPIVDIDQDRCRHVFGEIVREAGLRAIGTQQVQRRRSRGRQGREDDGDNDEGPDKEDGDPGPEPPTRRECTANRGDGPQALRRTT